MFSAICLQAAEAIWLAFPSTRLSKVYSENSGVVCCFTCPPGDLMASESRIFIIREPSSSLIVRTISCFKWLLICFRTDVLGASSVSVVPSSVALRGWIHRLNSFSGRVFLRDSKQRVQVWDVRRWIQKWKWYTNDTYCNKELIGAFHRKIFWGFVVGNPLCGFGGCGVIYATLSACMSFLSATLMAPRKAANP